MITETVFRINFKRLAWLWIPTDLRKKRLAEFIYCLIFPIEKMYLEFKNARKENLIRMNFNYQKFSLQRRLNDAFDRVERRIKIVPAVKYEGVYIYTEAESGTALNLHKWLHDDSHPLYLRTESELTSEFDFIVEIPNTAINILQLKAEIEYYKLFGKHYEIEVV